MTRASVRACVHIAAWNAMNATITNTGVSSTVVSAVEPRSTGPSGASRRATSAKSGSARGGDRVVGLVLDLRPEDAGDHGDAHTGGDEPEHLLQRDRTAVALGE